MNVILLTMSSLIPFHGEREAFPMKGIRRELQSTMIDEVMTCYVRTLGFVFLIVRAVHMKGSKMEVVLCFSLF